MAVTAKFQADFASFYSAVEKAEVELRGLETGAAKVEKSLNKMADSFSGRKIIQDANLAAAAIEKIGGATKLTEAEQKKINATVTEALAKYKALGIEAPQHLQKLAAETKTTNTELAKTPAAFGGITTGLKSLAASMGVAFSVVAVKQWVIGTLEAAAQIDDLSKKLGVSSEAVQRWSHAAKEGGASIETVDKAVSFMNKTLAEGDKSTVQAMKLMGLSFDEIRRSKPEDAFNAITKALQGVEDPMTRARIAMQLFGKTGQDLLPAIVDGFADVAAGASVMSNETVKRLAAAEDAWGRFGTKVTIVSGEILSTSMDVIGRATSSWENFFRTIAAGLPGIGTGAGLSALAPSQGFIGPKLDPAEQERRRKQAIQDSIAASAALANEEIARQKAARASEQHAEALARIHAAMVPLTTEQTRQIESLTKLGIAVGDISTVLKVSEVAVRGYVDSLREMERFVSSDKFMKPVLDMIKTRPLMALTESTEESVFKIAVAQEMQGAAKAIEDSAPIMAAAAKVASDPIHEQFAQTFNQITVMARTSAQLIRDAMITELDAELNAQKGVGFGIPQFQRQAAAQMRNRAGIQAQYERIPGFANGVSNFGGGMAWVGERGPELVTLPKGSSVTPNQALGGVTVNVYVSGGVDRATGRMVGDEAIKAMRAKGVKLGVKS